MTNLAGPPVFSTYTPHVNKPVCIRLYWQRIVFLFVLSWSTATQATVFTFDLRAGKAALALDGKNAGQLVNHGLTATFAAGPGAPIDGIFNQTSSRFGINSVGTSDDSSSLIDAVNDISEFLTISFGQRVLLSKITLSAFAPGEMAGLSIAGGTSLLLHGLAAAKDVYYFSNLTLGMGEQIRLSHVSGNGFSFENISLNSAKVQEPPVAVLMLSGVMAVIVFRRSRSRSSPD